MQQNRVLIGALIVACALVLCLVTVRACTDEDEVTLKAEAPIAYRYEQRWTGPTTTTTAPDVIEPVSDVIETPQPSPQSRTVRQSEPVESSSSSSMGLNWEALRQCESGGDYDARDSNFSGAYQFTDETWQGMGNTGRAADHPASVQDAQAQRLYDARGAQPWPVCGRLL